MSTNISTLVVTNMLLKTIQTLETVHGFGRVSLYHDHLAEHPTPPLEFSGVKPIWSDYIGVDVRLHINYRSNKRYWVISPAIFTRVYLGGVDREKDKEWIEVRDDYLVLSGSDFRGYKGRMKDDDVYWVVSCGADFTAFCKEYDKAAKHLGCVPIFFG